MIKSRVDVMDLLKEYLNTKYELTYQFWMSEAEEWCSKRQEMYYNGIVLGKFRERDSATMQVLKAGVEDEVLQYEIIKNIEYDIKMIEQLEEPDIFHQKKLESKKAQLNELQIYPINGWIEKNCRWLKEDSNKISDSEEKVLLFLYYTYENLDYERKHPYYNDLEELNTVYENIMDKQSQFAKYGIIPLDENRELIAVDPPRVYDKCINKTFFIKNIPLHLLQQISEMISAGEIVEFAVRLLSEPGYKGKMDCKYLAEALERGKIFDFVNLGNYSVSKLYSNIYENCMWVTIDQENITFEELYEDLEIYENMIVTQMIHLKYSEEDGKTYITHLDHEYIFYSIDEYERRLSDVTQKGEARERLKSFKIDNSRIPFYRRCKIQRKDIDGNDLPSESEQFLCYVLECYFKHKDLLKEYFQKVI